MPLGIRPIVDFVFKKIFGSPENSAALIGLLNAILDLPRPIVAVEILNPFNYQEFADSKLVILDVRCRDADGRFLNIEMQVSNYPGLLQRLVFYACSMYVDQLTKGASYASANLAISICLLNRIHFADTSQAHHRFQLLDKASGRELDKAIEVHTLELTKYNLSEATIAEASKLEQWVFLLLFAQNYDAATLRRLLPGIEFEKAIATIETISAKTEDKQMYDQREKAQRDHEWALAGAREQGVEQGIEKGMLAGKIQTLQELLGEEVMADATLVVLDNATLEDQLAALQLRLRERQA